MVFAIGSLLWSLRGGDFRERYRANRRAGWGKDAQRFTNHPWLWSLRTAAFAGLVVAASVGRVWPHGGWLMLGGVCFGVSVISLFLLRYWLGPRIRRKYLDPPAA